MHPCARPTPPAWCNKKGKKRKGALSGVSKRKTASRRGKMTCACPSGWEKKGIMCKRGSTFKRATCRKKSR